MKYRLGYDYLFLSKKEFANNNENIRAMCLYVLFKIFDKNGNEILFETDKETIEQKIEINKGSSIYLYNFFRCNFDRNELFSFEPTEFARKGKYSVSFEIQEYSKDLLDVNGVFLTPVMIEKDEFELIFKNNIDLFDTSDNKPTQTTSWFFEEVK